MRKEHRRLLVRKNECWFRRITPAFARQHPRYKHFVGMFLVTECTDNLEQGAVISELMVFQEQTRLHQHHNHAA